MTEKENKKISSNEEKNVREEVAKLREELNQIDLQKESWYKKKEEYGKEIANLIQEITKLKRERNSFTEKVKSAKKEREELNKALKPKFEAMKELKNKLPEKAKNNDPISIQKQIEGLESKIETEVMSFDNEKKIMKTIKDLKKKLDHSKDVMEVFKKIKEKSKEIDELKRKTNEKHKLVQNHAKESQEKHEQIPVISDKIDKLRQKEEEAYSKFLELKQQFVAINNKLKEHLKQLNEDRKKSVKISRAKKAKKAKIETMALKDKETEINKKIEKREKLTTEDLLAIQQIELRKTKKEA